MSKRLAIRGHSTRGNEVIEILEMMGGKNVRKLDGGANMYSYYLSDNIITSDRFSIAEDDEFEIFTLQDFLEKFPYKVGDKVHIYVQNDDIDGRYDIEVAEITSMRWNPARCKITYKMKDINREFYKEEIKCKVEESMEDKKLFGVVDNSTEAKSCTASLKAIEDSIDSVQFVQSGKIVAVRFNTQNYENEVELQLDDYEIVVRDGKTYAVHKKPAYPDNYEECVRIAKNIHGYDINIDAPAYRELLESFVKLLICRDAYWKIAGEQMGLDKPWEPDWLSGRKEEKYCIATQNNEIWHNFSEYGGNEILAFPTMEMRDAFYENFKNEIEQCKELL